MQVTYTVTAAEWREARYLYRTRGDRSSGDGWALLLIIVPLVGSIGDTVHKLRTSGFSAKGSVLPLLLLLASAAAAGLFWMSRYRARKAGETSGVTVGEWTANISETGVERAQGDVSIARSWDDVRHVRVGRHVMVMELRSEAGFEVFPLRAFSADEQAWLHRMTSRKLKTGRAEGGRVVLIRTKDAMPERAAQAKAEDDSAES